MGRTSKASDRPEEDYLSPDFDATKLTKPQLRSILAAHGVTDLPPATARKEALVELFQREVHGKAGRIRRERSRVRASDKGIAFLDEESKPSPKKSPRGRSKARKTAAAGAAPKMAKTRRSPSPSPVSKSPTRRLSRSPARKTLKSPTRTLRAAATSPPRAAKSPTRTAAPKATHTSPVRKSPPRQRTPSPRSRGRAESPLSMLSKSVPRYSDSPQSATVKLHDRLEYIASANRLTKAERILHETPKRAASPRRSPKPSSHLRLFSLRRCVVKCVDAVMPFVRFIVVLVLAVALGGYIRFKFFYPMSYCDSSVSLNSFLPQTWSPSALLTMVQQLCVPCPLHATCKNGRLICEDGFVPRRNWIALGSDCVPDRRKMSLVDDMISKIRQLLSERAGQAMCGEIEELGRVLTEAQLARALQQTYPLAEWNTAQFESLYRLALQDISRNPAMLHLDISNNPIDSTIMLQSSAPRVTISCRLRLYFLDVYQQHRMQIWIALLIFGTIGYVWISARRRNTTNKRVAELTEAVLQILAEQDALNRRDPTISSTISVHQIRDALFFKSSSRARNTLWPLVCKVIGRNSNVRESVMSVKGEQHRVWEWIGSDILSPLSSVFSNK